MGGKTKTSITSESRKTMKPRGKGKRTLIEDAFKKEKVTEEKFWQHAVNLALDNKHSQSGHYFKLIAERLYPVAKSTLPTVDFEFDEKASPAEQAKQITRAASKGEIPIDIAALFLSNIKAAVAVEEFTDLKKRIEELEKLAGVGQ